jgi:hypothetical protein
MIHTRISWLLAIVLVGLPLWADEEPDAPPIVATEGPEPSPIAQPDPAKIAESIHRGIEFLLSHQNHDGSWGSANITRPQDVYAPVPGAHQAFRH